MITKLLLSLQKIKYSIYIFLGFLWEAKRFFFLLHRHNASSNTNGNILKMQYTLLRENHVIEKGMSIKNPKNGFGVQKVLNLLERLTKYYRLYNNKDFILYPLNTIKTYIEYSKKNNVEISIVEKKFNDLISIIEGCILDIDAGVKLISKDEIWSMSNINFFDFARSRHSIRYFSTEIPQKEIIYKALEIAQLTPSACNRQSWFNYVFLGDKSREILKWQGGANGFENDIPISILVTSNLNAFLHYEPYQAYVDGGLYSMNLIYALHSLGLGTIPLSVGFNCNKIKQMHNIFRIPENEVPIVIIGVGCLLETFKVAISKRNKVQSVARFHS